MRLFYVFKKLINFIIYHFLNILFCILILYPIVWLVLSSFKNDSEIFSLTLNILPLKWISSNYASGVEGIRDHPLELFLKNSFIISTISTLLTVFISSITGFGFAKNKFFLKKLWLFLLYGGMIFPYQAFIIPQYVIFRSTVLNETFWPVIFTMGFGTPLYIFFVIQFMKTIPAEIEESAIMDGCGKFDLFLRIYMPLSKSVIFVIALFSFCFSWNDFLLPMLYLKNINLWPISTAIRELMLSTLTNKWGIIFAVTVMALLPPFILFLFLQRHITQGIKKSGLKG